MHMHMCMCMCMQELMRYETMVSLAQTQLKVPVVTAEVRRSAIDLFPKSRQATSNYGMQCSHIDTMQAGAQAMEWKVTVSLGSERMQVNLGENGSEHPPLVGMLIYDAYR